MAILVEFVQNIFMVGLWCTGMWLWTRREMGSSQMLAIICLLFSAIVGPLFVSATELFIDPQAVDAFLTWNDVGTMGVFLVFEFLALFYFAASWGNWKLDIVIGAAMGLILSIVQGYTLPGAPVTRLVWHAIAMALSFPLLVVGIRFSLQMAQTWWRFLVLVCVVVMMASALIVVVDYGLGGVL